MSKKPDDPSTTSAAYDAMVPRWARMRALLGGTEAMRAGGKFFLPMHERESETAYKERLNSAVLFNATDITLGEWVGRPFSRPVRTSAQVPAEFVEDVDQQGNNITVFARNWFREGIAMAFSHVLVEFPRAAEGQPRTLADDRRDRLRPYFVHVPPENLIFARSSVVAGQEILDHVRIVERSVVPLGDFGEREVVRIRVYDRPGQDQDVVVRIFEQVKDPKSKKVAWIPQQPFTIDSKVIPLVTFYADRQDMLLGKSPLLDLADLNVRHWQSSSDQNTILTVTRFPMLASSGKANLPIRTMPDGSREPDLVVGPATWLHIDDPQGKFYYVEHTGAAIAAGRQDLLDLRDQMAEYGAQFLRKRPGGETATARALDSAEATSPLQDAAIRFQDSLNTALSLAATWAKSSGWTAEIETDFGPETVETADFQLLGDARKNRDLSRSTFLRELQRRAVLGEDFDEDENARELESEDMDFGGEPTDKKPIDPFAEE